MKILKFSIFVLFIILKHKDKNKMENVRAPHSTAIIGVVTQLLNKSQQLMLQETEIMSYEYTRTGAICRFCNLNIPVADRFRITIINHSKPGEETHFHFSCPFSTGIITSKELFNEFKAVSHNKVLDPFGLSGVPYRKVMSLINKIEKTSEESKRKVLSNRFVEALILAEKFRQIQRKEARHYLQLQTNLGSMHKIKDAAVA